jgi:hypothetical protein
MKHLEKAGRILKNSGALHLNQNSCAYLPIIVLSELFPRPVYKPHSVQRSSRGRLGDHLSGPYVSIRLKRPTRDLRGEPPPAHTKVDIIPAWPCSWRGLPGRPHYCGRRWSFTPPFHPYLDCAAAHGRFVSVARSGRLSHCWVSPPRGFPGAMLYGVRTFLDSLKGSRDRPTDLRLSSYYLDSSSSIPGAPADLTGF